MHNTEVNPLTFRDIGLFMIIGACFLLIFLAKTDVWKNTPLKE